MKFLSSHTANNGLSERTSNTETPGWVTRQNEYQKDLKISIPLEVNFSYGCYVTFYMNCSVTMVTLPSPPWRTTEKSHIHSFYLVVYSTLPP